MDVYFGCCVGFMYFYGHCTLCVSALAVSMLCLRRDQLVQSREFIVLRESRTLDCMSASKFQPTLTSPILLVLCSRNAPAHHRSHGRGPLMSWRSRKLPQQNRKRKVKRS